jgi:hypothetical protein
MVERRTPVLVVPPVVGGRVAGLPVVLTTEPELFDTQVDPVQLSSVVAESEPFAADPRFGRRSGGERAIHRQREVGGNRRCRGAEDQGDPRRMIRFESIRISLSTGRRTGSTGPPPRAPGRRLGGPGDDSRPPSRWIGT